jgi:hypothetical protein
MVAQRRSLVCARDGAAGRAALLLRRQNWAEESVNCAIGDVTMEAARGSLVSPVAVGSLVAVRRTRACGAMGAGEEGQLVAKEPRERVTKAWFCQTIRPLDSPPKWYKWNSTSCQAPSRVGCCVLIPHPTRQRNDKWCVLPDKRPTRPYNDFEAAPASALI